MAAASHEEIEEQVRNLQAKRQGLSSSGPPNEDEEERVGLGTTGHFDQDIYGNGGISMDSRFAGYDTSIAVTDEPDEEEDTTTVLGKKSTYTAPLNLLHETANDKDYDPLAEHRIAKISDREDEYRARRRTMIISPERYDPFAEEPDFKVLWM